MKVNIFHEPQLKENHVDVHYGTEDAQLKALKNYLDTFQVPILGKNQQEEKERLIFPGEILYLEIVERRCFLYLMDSFWKCDQTIAGFLDKYENQGFVRVSKSMVINIHHVKELKAELNMRIHVVLDNDETVVLNRNYRKEFMKSIMQLRRENN